MSDDTKTTSRLDPKGAGLTQDPPAKSAKSERVKGEQSGTSGGGSTDSPNGAGLT